MSNSAHDGHRQQYNRLCPSEKEIRALHKLAEEPSASGNTAS